MLDICKPIKLRKERFGFGIPNNLVKEEGARWVPIGNIRFKWQKTGWSRHYRQTCPECGKKRKNIRYHYKVHHPKFWEEVFIKPFYKAQVGELYGVRFMTTKPATVLHKK